jgi:peptide chain release factor 2
LCGTLFDVSQKEKLLKDLEEQSTQVGFWEDVEKAKKILQKAQNIRSIVKRFAKISLEREELGEWIAIAQSEEEKQQVERMLFSLEKEIEDIDIMTLFSGKYDENDVFLTIQSGAGGVDAQDWAEMLLRMYLRWCERHNFVATLIDESRGIEAGIKSATLQISGIYPYGNLKYEMGTHRLVRLSPFNANQLRQTSFAKVEVLPVIASLEDVSIDEKDLRIDTFRASGAGGQHINKTDSAVRITHIPTGIVVSCQSERSQAQNKEQAMAFLMSKLHIRALEEKKEETEKLRGEKKSAQWGSQIRSYVFHPYTLVKDHRTKAQTPQVYDVLDGDIDMFIEAELRNQV